MVFTAPSWVPPLDMDPPDSIPLNEFILNERYGRHPLHHSRPPFTCGLTGAEYSAVEVKGRVNALARALSQELGWHPNRGSEWDKIDTLTLTWAVHSLSGIASPANAAYSEAELEYQLKSSGSKALFTCLPLLHTSIAAAEKSGIPRNHIYLLELPKETTGGQPNPSEFKTVGQLIEDSLALPQLEEVKWSQGQGARQTAFLCYSSGTSGLPKGVMISHRNIISNILQLSTYDRPYRSSQKQPGDQYDPTQICLGLLPQSHIYSLVVICHASIYRGDQVPPIIIAMAKNQQLLSTFDLTSVKEIFTGAAPLGAETAQELQQHYPDWAIRQGYGNEHGSVCWMF
ncbi:MAG: hypothetical protein Q9163_001742 [Psora crenata]